MAALASQRRDSVAVTVLLFVVLALAMAGQSVAVASQRSSFGDPESACIFRSALFWPNRQ